MNDQFEKHQHTRGFSTQCLYLHSRYPDIGLMDDVELWIRTPSKIRWLGSTAIFNHCIYHRNNLMLEVNVWLFDETRSGNPKACKDHEAQVVV